MSVTRLCPDTHSKRQAMRHDCPSSLLKLKQCLVWKNILYQASQGSKGRKKSFVQYQHEKLNEPTKKGPLSYVLHESPFARVSTRENREGRPLLTGETKAIGDLWSTNERVLPWLVRWARRAATRDFYSALAVLASPEQNIFFLAAHFFHFMCPHRPATWGGQLVVPGRLSLNMCLWFQQSAGATLLQSLMPSTAYLLICVSGFNSQQGPPLSLFSLTVPPTPHSNRLLIAISLAYPSDALRGLIAFRTGFTDAPDAVVAQPVRCRVTHVVI